MCPFCKKQCENIPSRQTWWLLGRLAAVAWKQDVMMKVGVWDLPTYMESSSISKHLRWLTSLISVSSILLLFPFKHHGVVQLAKLFGLLLSFPFAKVKHRCPFFMAQRGYKAAMARLRLWWFGIFMLGLAGGQLSTRSGWTSSWWTLDFSTGGLVSKCRRDFFWFRHMGFWDVSPQWLRIVCSPWRSSPRSWLASAWHLSNESSQGIYALQRFFPHPFHEICFVFDLLLVQMKLCIPSWKKLEKRTVLLDGPEATFGWNHSSWVKRQRMAILVPFGTDICISVQCIFRDYLDPLGGTVVFIDPPKKTLPQICRKKWSGVQSFTGVALPLLEVFFNQCWAGHIFSGYQDVHSTGGTCWKHSGRILNGLSWFISQKVQGWPPSETWGTP